jgi:hypothetical protein
MLTQEKKDIPALKSLSLTHVPRPISSSALPGHRLAITGSECMFSHLGPTLPLFDNTITFAKSSYFKFRSALGLAE